ncbi:hypothetical protein ACFP3U_18400 [Kitasatospora misakiensis]|uniref:Integrase n=1 Tax=Kitasatospora misakiensis TaxID=67330 RepID=A0ABW0X309_9ACTN
MPPANASITDATRAYLSRLPGEQGRYAGSRRRTLRSCRGWAW